ncbi:MAG TPA: phenylacetate--CoA ligase [Anaerolineae bacterium]|jgi:phenylacetate-CoA ligase|nr:phenylacetate--CoA ligase [Anaerolineae bacterium]
MIWNREREAMPREQLKKVQLEGLRNTIKRVYERVPMYKKRLDEAGISPDSIKSLDDLERLPFTLKTDLRDNYPFGMFAVPMKEIVRLHASSGTTGKSTVVGYTANDIATWAELMARTLTSAGATSDDVVHNAYGYGLFTGGLGIHYGAERVGASVIPISGGNTKRQITIMEDFGSTILACTPSYAMFLAEVAEEMGLKDKLMLKAGIFGAEPWSNSMREDLEKRLGILAIDIYGLSEIIGPGVAYECPEKHGLHIAEDHFIVEIIDPDTGERVPPGEKGELVFTTITKEAIPVIRYRTRDISAVNFEPCSCGRTLARMDRVTGRTDDMLIIRGVNVFPSQIESVLMEIDGVEPHYMIIVDRVGQLDIMQVQVEVNERFFSDEVRHLEEFEKKVKREIESLLNISVDVMLVEPKTIQRSEGKAKRVIDNRKI